MRMMFTKGLTAWSVAAVLGLPVAAAAQGLVDPGAFAPTDIEAAVQLRDATLKNNASYAITESLTTEVGPRLAGSPADAKAVAWAEAKFRELGFDRVWKEPVSFRTWKRGVERARVVAPFEQPLLITALGNSVATPEGGLKAEVVSFATFADLQAADAKQVKGKIVFINHQMQDSSQYGFVVAGRNTGPSEAAAKGAVGIVIRSVGTDRSRFPHTGVTTFKDGVTPIPAAAMSIADADLLVRIFQRGKPVQMQLEIGAQMGERYTSHNVIGEITGSELPDEYVLIGAHLDSWDLGTGAIDDGAGCGITMAAAAAIKKMGLKPRRSIRVILFANEESGLVGARAYLAAHKDHLSKIQAVAEADQGQGPVIQFNTFVPDDVLPLMAQIQEVLTPLNVAVGHNNAYAGPDMEVLRKAGVAGFGLRLKSDDYFNYHHTPDDTFDKIEPARINQSTAAYAVFAWLAAQSPSSFGSGQPALLERLKSGK